jgi:hypothetical protein
MQEGLCGKKSAFCFGYLLDDCVFIGGIDGLPRSTGIAYLIIDNPVET